DGAEILGPLFQLLVDGPVAVFDVPQHRGIEIGQVGPNLVGPSGDKTNPAEGKGTLLFLNLYLGDDFLVPFGGAFANRYLVGLFIVPEVGGVPPFRGKAKGDGKVGLAQQVLLDDS